MLSKKEWEILDKVNEYISIEIETKNKEPFQKYLRENIPNLVISNPHRLAAIDLPPEKIIKFSLYMLNFSIAAIADKIKKYIDKNPQVRLRLGKTGRFIHAGMNIIQITSFLNGAIDSIS